MTPNEARERLVGAVAALERGIERAEESIRAELASGPSWRAECLTPDDMKDSNGRPILADLRASLVVGLAALSAPAGPCDRRPEGGERLNGFCPLCGLALAVHRRD